jgi:hypothetical protein
MSALLGDLENAAIVSPKERKHTITILIVIILNVFMVKNKSGFWMVEK